MLTTTRRLLIAVIAAIFIPAALAGGQGPPPPPAAPAAVSAAQVVDPRCPRGLHSVADYRGYASRVYRRDTVSRDAHRRLAYMLKCQHSRWATRMAARYHARFKTAREHRQQSAACTPFGKWAIPPYIVMRESGGRNVPEASGASDASGFYQILSSTWVGAGGPDLKGVRHVAMAFPKRVQDCVAHRLWNGGNNNHWALTR